MSRRTGRTSGTRRAPRAARAGRSPAIGLLDRPLTSYYLVLGCTMLLLALGMAMVLSASSIRQTRYTGSAFTLFQKQALWVAIGLPLHVAGGPPAGAGRSARWPTR